MLRPPKHLLLIVLPIILYSLAEVAIYNLISIEESQKKAEIQVHSEHLVERYIDEIDNIYNALHLVKVPDYEKDPEYIERSQKVLKKYLEDKSMSLAAVNAVDKNGKIVLVFPKEPNLAALNKNLLQREDVKKYLLRAKDSGMPTMTHVVKTYQGFPGIAIYEPRLSANGEFQGWYNYLIRYDDFIHNYMGHFDIHDFSVEIIWKNNPDRKETYKSKNYNESLTSYHELTKTRTLFGQDLVFKIRYHCDHHSSQLSYFDYLVWFCRLAFLLLIITSILYIKENRQVQRRNKKIELQKVLINTVSHDIATPISIIDLLLSRIKDSLNAKDWQRFSYGIQRLKEILNKTREIQSLEIHNPVITFNKESLKNAIDASINFVLDKATQKNIKITNDVHSEIMVYTNRDILINNILINALDNAIKFSDENTEVRISASTKSSKVYLYIEDQGSGIQPEKLKKLLKQKKLISGEGSSGEKGSGLGWIQIYYFLAKIDAEIQIETNSDPHKGATYTKLEITLPKDDPTKG